MNAEPYLKQISQALRAAKLEAVMIGNAAAAVQGAPVTTLDVDFMVRDTDTNRSKIEKFAEKMGMKVWQPNPQVSSFWRVANSEDGFNVDFLTEVTGVKSFASLRSRASLIRFKGYDLLVADLSDIIRSKRMTGRKKDNAVVPVLEDALREKKKSKQI